MNGTKILDILKHAFMISLFVIVMMLLIEYLTVQTKGRWSRPFNKSSWLQIVFSAFMGIIPGCLGTYTIVSMYTHKILKFSALITVMIATFGDEAFYMFSMVPDTALVVLLLLFGIAIIAGFITNVFTENKEILVLKQNHLKFHEEEPDCNCFIPHTIIPQLRHISFHRALLLTGGSLFIIFLLSGDIGPINWGWEKITFLIVSLVGIFIIMTVPDHFLSKHLWGHVIKKHSLKILLWTIGTFIVIHFIEYFLDIDEFINANYILILLIAISVGIIPESGPNLIFISLFASGQLPFGILLANSIVQDGHGSIPLLAESRKSFVLMKLVNALAGFLVGMILYFV